MQRLITTAVLALVAGTALVAQQVRPLPQAELYGELLKLQSFTSVLYIAAHPDDENTRLLSWLARGKHIRTAYLSLTRGDGGQNILGSEQGAALGLIRTNELLAARRLDGAEQFFARAIDFGYSKNAEETFKHWDKDALTQDVVKVIEQFRPDVVICRFPASRMAGHGQHEASAIIAKAAFDACPQNIRPKRLLFNAYRFGDRSTIADDQFALEVGQYDPLLGMGYGELAGYSRSLHKSQGAGTRSTPGVQNEYFETLGGEPPSTSLFDGLDTTWLRVGRPDIGHRIGQVIEQFWDGPPSDVLPELLKIRDMISKMREPFWKDLKLQQIDNVILSAMGLTADLSVNTPIAVAGDSLSSTLRIVARAGSVPVEIVGLEWPGAAMNPRLSLPHDSLREEALPYRIPDGQAPTQPYWLVDDPSGDLYSVARSEFLGLPMTPPSLTMTVTLRVSDASISLRLPLSYKTTDPLDGDVIEELRIVPTVSVEPASKLSLRTPTGLAASVRLRAYQAFENATVIMHSSSGEHVIAKGLSMRSSTDTLLTFSPTVKTTQQVSFAVRIDDREYDRGVKVIDYDHLPTLQYLEPARMTIVPEEIKISAKRVAFIPGAGEYAPDFLRELGVVVDEVSEDQILRIDEMLQYDAVLVGIRAVNINDNMKYIMPALMEYVKRGGTLVMQYNTSRGLSTEELGPYPLKLTRDRVTEEDAEVTILKADSPVLTTPNAIAATDFDGWVQERGLYFPSERDARYEALLSMHDTGEEPLDGSILYAKYGKGHYVYCALSLFRELPAGVPGGMKLMANMVSLGR